MWNNFNVEYSNFWLFQTLLKIYIEVLIAMCKHFLFKSNLVCSDADGPYTLAYEVRYVCHIQGALCYMFHWVSSIILQKELIQTVKSCSKLWFLSFLVSFLFSAIQSEKRFHSMDLMGYWTVSQELRQKNPKGNDHEILVLDRPANQRNHTIWA